MTKLFILKSFQLKENNFMEFYMDIYRVDTA